MLVAAYQTLNEITQDADASLTLVREQVKECERIGASIVCFPEGVIGGLADNTTGRYSFAIRSIDVASRLGPLAIGPCAAIVGFTEIEDGLLYNSAAVIYRGEVLGVYRKLHPAIRQSVYSPGDKLTVFEVGGLTFGILICNDSNFPEHSHELASKGARVIFIPSNNTLPADRADVVESAKNVDAATAKAVGVFVVRSDVVGALADRTSLGTTRITAPDGTTLARPGRSGTAVTAAI